VTPVRVVADEPDLLAVYLERGSELRYPPGDHPRGEHPWSQRGKTRWHGNGVLQLHRPRDWHSLMVFWLGAERRFHGWYVNFQRPYERHADAFDTADLELDIWIPREGPWVWKDVETFEAAVAAGTIDPEAAAAVRAEADAIARALEAGERWWDERWADWAPPPDWAVPVLADDEAVA
jgi:hypothetical protein